MKQHGFFALNQRRIQIGLRERHALHHVAQKLHVRCQPDDVRVRQRRIEPRQGLFARVAVHDEFGDHRVVKRTNRIAFAHAGINPHPARSACKRRVRWQTVNVQRASGGQEIVIGVFGANPCFNRVALNPQIGLLQRQRFARRDAQLPFDQIQSGNRFGDGVFDLQARVHLHKEEIHRTIRALFDDKFDRSRADIINRPRRRNRRRAHFFAQGLRHTRSGRFFQHFLVTALHRAIAFKQIHIIAVRIAKHLNFDMARTLHVFFDEHRVITKTVNRFAFAACQGIGKIFGFVNRPHSFTAAARAGFDENGITDAVGFALQQFGVLVAAVIPRNQRNARFFHQLFGFGFQPHRPNAKRPRADKRDARIGAGLGEIGVFAQKPVARMHRLRSGFFGGGEDFFPPQITITRRTTAQMHGFIAHRNVLRIGIGIGINCYGFNS